ncbi:LytR/AlgR family response regulator transcription factor [Epilithonimonas tenax]|uniref:LytR/AlgR family response regulator transcription factor n=1 Tax=Epilithonimonas tenax TaxID=191577 RepID=UPI0004807338|nr:LytTR family DNA-binding domain-containing protein [Epilithonimonas tenax]
MNTYRCVIVDDNELDRLTITSYLSRFDDLEIVKVCSNATDALVATDNNEVDILFLDIDMPNMSGLELRKKAKQVPICIFATDHPEFALESFELETLDYLLKPYSFERFSLCVNRIREYMRIRTKAIQYEFEEERNVFYVKEGHKKVKIFLNDVLYLNAFQNYTLIVTLTDKHYVLMSLGSLLKEVNFQEFLRVHKSYAVNPDYITSIKTKEIILKSETPIPIGRSYKENLNHFK